MGLLICKRSCCCCCCNYCITGSKKLNSVDPLPDVKLRVLLLGPVGSGKTEVGHALSHKARLDYESTNGVQYYRVPLSRVVAGGERSGELAITEIGGNEEMRKIWPHYYVQTVGIIYCFDLSSGQDGMWQTFRLLEQLLRHEFVRGKPVLLVATKSQLVDSGLQLYDIENEFQLERLARSCGSSIRLCYYECDAAQQRQRAVGTSLALGVHWLAKYLLDNWCILSTRIKCDENAKLCQEEQTRLVAREKLKQQQQNRIGNGVPQNHRRSRFQGRFSKVNRLRSLPGGRVRPHTAPPRVMSSSHSAACQQPYINSSTTTSINRVTAVTTIASDNTNECSDPVPNGCIKPHIEHT